MVAAGPGESGLAGFSLGLADALVGEEHGGVVHDL
jgi:hypothetical protein